MLQDFVSITLKFPVPEIEQISSLFPYIHVNFHGKFLILKIPGILQPLDISYVFILHTKNVLKYEMKHPVRYEQTVRNSFYGY